MQIAASIAEFGFVNPILVGPDNVIVAGHAYVLAARKLGLTEVQVVVLGLQMGTAIPLAMFSPVTRA